MHGDSSRMHRSSCIISSSSSSSNKRERKGKKNALEREIVFHLFCVFFFLSPFLPTLSDVCVCVCLCLTLHIAQIYSISERGKRKRFFPSAHRFVENKYLFSFLLYCIYKLYIKGGGWIVASEREREREKGVVHVFKAGDLNNARCQWIRLPFRLLIKSSFLFSEWTR